jgi:hypothetical protein
MVQPSFELRMTSEAQLQIEQIIGDPARLGLQKQLKKSLGHLSNNPQHPGLNSHPMASFEAVYKINNTPQAHRILWAYGPKPRQITILTVIPHY